jgi:hypothetical protein
MIAQEGVKSLTFEELQQACIARGMPATGLSKVALRFVPHHPARPRNSSLRAANSQWHTRTHDITGSNWRNGWTLRSMSSCPP